MSKIILYKALELPNYLDTFADDVKTQLGSDSDLILDYPVVYIHIWRSKQNIADNNYSMYIGETNNIIQRTKEH